MAELMSIFEKCLEFAPTADLEAFLTDVPAKWVVYLFADEHDRPIQLLCVKNLRQSLKRRLSGEEPVGLTKKIPYRQMVRRIYWRRVDSAFEADWIYLDAARQVFPRTYRGMVGFRPAWFIHVNPQAPFPRYTRTTDLSAPAGQLIGPVEDKHAAQRLIQLAEDCFDLCRYYNILVQAPHGKACAYKEMGKCPAPCDGSIPMDEYRRMVLGSAQAITEPGPFLADQQRQMQRAAEALEFEKAARLKARLEQAKQLGQGPFRHARRLGDFAYVLVQRGPRAGTAKLFLAVGGTIEHCLSLIAEPGHDTEPAKYLLQRASELAGQGMTEAGAEHVALVANHLFAPKQTQGLILRLEALDERSLAKAYRDLRRQKEPEEADGEGIVKELQAM